MTQEELILEPGKYTVQIALESDNFHVSAPKEYALTLYNESDFFELVLRDETRGEPVADYTYDSATGAFDVSAWYGTALGEYTFYGFELRDNTGDGASFDLTDMRFSLTGEDGSFVSLEELAFRADKPGEYALYYQMSGSAEGEIFSVSGAVTLVIQPIDLADVIDARLDVEGDPQYPNYEVLYDGDAPQTSDILILDAVQAIEAWGGYRLSLADLTVTFIDRNGASHTGVVDLQMEDGLSWLEITEVLVQWDEYHTPLSFDGFEWFTYWYKSYHSMMAMAP